MREYQRVIYVGRVQGVGFRYSVKQIASGYDVVGSVRNLDDGSVELHVGGESTEVDAFLKAIAEGHLARHIKEVRATAEEPFPDGTQGFEIRR